MTAKEIQYLETPRTQNNKIGTGSTTDGGTEHPLWTILNNRFKPDMPWRSLKGQERAGIVRAAKLLHEQGIPYNFYADFIQRFNKVYLKRHPQTLTAYRTKKNGAVPLLQEYLIEMRCCRAAYAENPAILRVNDAVYRMFPDAYGLGIMKFMYSVGAIKNALQIQDEQQLLRLASRSTTIEDFWNNLGRVADQPAPAPAVDLQDGQDHTEVVRTLGKELQIRMGNVGGKTNPALDRFFNTKGKLNVQGLKVISGERQL